MSQWDLPQIEDERGLVTARGQRTNLLMVAALHGDREFEAMISSMTDSEILYYVRAMHRGRD